MSTLAVYFVQMCISSAADSAPLALADAGTEKIYIDSSSDEVLVQYTGPGEM